MNPKIIVMIVTIATPGGDNGVHVKPMPSATICQQKADVEATDPFVLSVECAELVDGVLKLEFHRAESNGGSADSDPGDTPAG